MAKKNSVIYSYSCGRIDCEEEYIGESGRTFGERFKELEGPISNIWTSKQQWP